MLRRLRMVKAHDGSWFRVCPGGCPPGVSPVLYRSSMLWAFPNLETRLRQWFRVVSWFSTGWELAIAEKGKSDWISHQIGIGHWSDIKMIKVGLGTLFELICAQITSDLNDLMSSNGFMKDYEGFLGPRLSTIHNEGPLLRSHTVIFTSEFHRLRS